MKLELRLGLIVVATILIAAAPAMAQEIEDWRGSECSPAGTWIGGSDAAKYMMNITPITPFRMNTVAEGSYLPTQTGAQVSTTWSGEIRRGPHGVWEGWAVQVSSVSGALFPDPMDITVTGSTPSKVARLPAAISNTQLV